MPADPPLLITGLRAAALLAEGRTAILLKPFMRRECTVSDAAREAGLPLGQMHYYVTQFLRAGLLCVVRNVPRRGRAVKVYRAVSRTFRVPLSVLPDPVAARALTDRFWEEEVSSDRLRSAPQVTELLVELQPRGTLRIQPVALGEDREHVPSFQLRSGGLFLTKEEARELGRELQALYDRYEQLHGPERYGLRVDVLPIDRPVDPPTEEEGTHDSRMPQAFALDGSGGAG